MYRKVMFLSLSLSLSLSLVGCGEDAGASQPPAEGGTAGEGAGAGGQAGSAGAGGAGGSEPVDCRPPGYQESDRPCEAPECWHSEDCSQLVISSVPYDSSHVPGGGTYAAIQGACDMDGNPGPELHLCAQAEMESAYAGGYRSMLAANCLEGWVQDELRASLCDEPCTATEIDEHCSGGILYRDTSRIPAGTEHTADTYFCCGGG
jgi:hypothetical protein